ncbi:hypothetical protein GALMADRAFT_136444 [Galerina marginata CBS 339.88]|uniref:Uncharacterized protein n=1 Tax=Galerina marginata (strain CBS 339.88) TaxID=685588 RepID=A0A067T9H0_GALM3|nr:hypothetical protein GALMADRAFT_136444 [Galerina marginata CBS 339.88]
MFNNTVTLALVALGTDVLINVDQLFTANDITISIRQMCKIVLLITKLRTVWMTALRWFMVENFIDKATLALAIIPVPMLWH